MDFIQMKFIVFCILLLTSFIVRAEGAYQIIEYAPTMVMPPNTINRPATQCTDGTQVYAGRQYYITTYAGGSCGGEYPPNSEVHNYCGSTCLSVLISVPLEMEATCPQGGELSGDQTKCVIGCPWAAPYNPATQMCEPDNSYCIKGTQVSTPISGSGWPDSCDQGCTVNWGAKVGGNAYGEYTGGQCSFPPSSNNGPNNNLGGSTNPDTNPSAPDDPDPDEPDTPDPTPPDPDEPNPDAPPDLDSAGIIEAINAANRSITGAVNAARNEIVTSIGNQTTDLFNALMNVKDGVVNAVNYSREVLDQSINELKALTDARLKDIKKQVFDSIDKLGKDLDTLLTKINLGIAGIKNHITDSIENQTTELLGSISTLKSDVLGAITGQTNTLVDTINGQTDAITNAIENQGSGDCQPGDTTAGCSSLGTLNETVDSSNVDLGVLTPGNASTLSACPAPIPFSFGSHSTNVEFTEICNAAESYVRPLVLLFASYAGFMIFTAGLKGG